MNLLEGEPAGSAPGAGVAASAWPPRPARGWQGRLAGLRSIGWPGMVSALVALALLLAFTQVVSKAVQVGESRQRAAAVHFDATWRCKAERDRLLRQDCLARLDATTPPDRRRAGHRLGALSGR